MLKFKTKDKLNYLGLITERRGGEENELQESITEVTRFVEAPINVVVQIYIEQLDRSRA